MLDSTLAVPNPGPGQSTVYVVDGRRATVRAAAVKMAKYFGLLIHEDNNEYPDEQWYRTTSNEGPFVHAIYGRYGTVRYKEDPRVADYPLKFFLTSPVGPVVARAAVDRVLKDFGLTASPDSEFFPGEFPAPPMFFGSGVTDGIPMDNLAFPINVAVGDGGKIVRFDMSGRAVRPVAVLDSLSVEESLRLDGRGITMDQATAKPTKTYITEPVTDDVSIVVPGWKVPILKDASDGITLLGVDPKQMTDLKKRLS